MERNGTESADPVGFNGPTTALAQRSTMEAVAQVKYEMEAIVAQSRMYPRDEHQALQRMLTAAKRPGFAAEAAYCFPRGGADVTGTSVSLTRPLAAYWGYIRTGWRIIAEDEEYVHLQGFAHDVQTGAIRTQEDRCKKSIQRKNKKSGVTEWVRPDERDLRELLGRRGAILERNCVLAVIPPDIVASVREACEKTLIDFENGNLKESREDTIRKLVINFGEIGVTKEMLETYLGHPLVTVEAPEVARLRGVFKSIRDGNTTIANHFEQPVSARPETPSATINLKAAREGVAVNPPGGAPIGKVEPVTARVVEAKPVAAPEPEPPPPASFDAEPEPDSFSSRWFAGIEIFPDSFPEGWQSGKVSTKPPMDAYTFETIATATDPKAVAWVADILKRGAEKQLAEGRVAVQFQQLSEAVRLARLAGGAS